MSLGLTKIHLEADQKMALDALAKQRSLTLSDLVREALDGLLLGVSPVELAQLDGATERAEVDIEAMVQAHDANTESHRAFMTEIAKLRVASDAS